MEGTEDDNKPPIKIPPVQSRPPKMSLLLLLLLLLTAIGLSPGGSGYFTCTQIWKKSN